MVEGLTARRSHSRRKGQVVIVLAQQAEGVGVDRAHPVLVAEVAGRPGGRVQLRHLPPQQPGLAGQGGQEGVDGLGVLHVTEQLPTPPAGDVAPLVGLIGVL